MRKLVLLLAVLALAAMPSVADAAKKKAKKAAAKPAPAAQAGIPEQPIVKFFQVGTSKRHPTPGADAAAGKGKKSAKKK
jgi:hypothetical protein